MKYPFLIIIIIYLFLKLFEVFLHLCASKMDPNFYLTSFGPTYCLWKIPCFTQSNNIHSVDRNLYSGDAYSSVYWFWHFVIVYASQLSWHTLSLL